MPPSYSNPRNSQAGQTAAGLLKPGLAFVVIIFGALLAFEVFNYSTTDLALRDLLGDLTFLGFHWSTILALAFCGIDFAGIARLFTPEQGAEEPKEVWYLFGAWLLAATMNAILTWWGVSMAVVNHTVQSSSIVDPATINNVVPVFVAVMVWVIRILIIGTLSLAIDRMANPGKEQHTPLERAAAASVSAAAAGRLHPSSERVSHIPTGLNSSGFPQQRPMPAARAAAPRVSRPAAPQNEDESDSGGSGFPSVLEPTYHSLSARPARPQTGNARSEPGSSHQSARRY